MENDSGRDPGKKEDLGEEPPSMRWRNIAKMVVWLDTEGESRVEMIISRDILHVL